MPDSPHTFDSAIPAEWIEELQPRLDFLRRKLLLQGEYEDLEAALMEGLKKRVRLSVFSALTYLAVLLMMALMAVFVEGESGPVLLFLTGGFGLISGLRAAFDVKLQLKTHAMVQAVHRRVVESASAPACA